MRFRVERWQSLVLLLLVGCASAPLSKINHTEGDLKGMVYDLDRQPLADASVEVMGGRGPAPVITDLHGRFGLGPVAFGPMTLKVTKAGYESLSWQFRFIEGSQVVYLQLASTDQLLARAAVALEKKEWREFQDNLDRAKVLEPQSLQAKILEATGLQFRGRVDEAVKLLESHHSERPILAVELLLGDLYDAAGRRDQALIHWKKALDIKEDAAVRAKVEKE